MSDALDLLYLAFLAACVFAVVLFGLGFLCKLSYYVFKFGWGLV